MTKQITDFKLVESQDFGRSVLLRLRAEQVLPTIVPGQFVQVRVDGSPSTYLRRPISIHDVDVEQNEITLLVQQVGEGTRHLAALKVGDTINMVLPLGNGFSLPEKGGKCLLVGKGFVTMHSVWQRQSFDKIYVCGPKPMMKAVAKLADEKGVWCEVSLENLMACGLGACLCCVEDTIDGHVCVCKEGPVFNIRRLKW